MGSTGEYNHLSFGHAVQGGGRRGKGFLNVDYSGLSTDQFQKNLATPQIS